MSFWGELRRRNVFRVGAAYLAGAWLLAQVAGVFAPALNLPEWVTPFVVFMLVLGFPVALFLAWAYEVTPEGIRRTKQVPLSESLTKITAQRLNYLITALLAVAVVLMAIDDYGPHASDSNETTAVQRAILPNSLAVLQCDSFSTDPEKDFFAASLHDELLNQLEKLQNLSVFARTSVLPYADSGLSIPQIARELKAQSIMECSVAFGDGRVVVRTQLIDGDSGLHLWSDSYNREFADIFEIQADIARSIANALNTKFSSVEMRAIETPPTLSVETYEAYLQAQQLADLSGRSEAELRYLEEAIRLDPDFEPGRMLSVLWLAHAEGMMGDSTAAIELLRFVEQLPGAHQLPLTLANLAYAYSRNGRLDDARRLFEMLDTKSPDRRHHAATWALAHLAIGDEQRSRESLEIVIDKIAKREPEAGLVALRLIRWNVYAQPLLDEPPFSDLRSQLHGY